MVIALLDVNTDVGSIVDDPRAVEADQRGDAFNFRWASHCDRHLSKTRHTMPS